MGEEISLAVSLTTTVCFDACCFGFYWGLSLLRSVGRVHVVISFNLTV